MNIVKEYEDLKIYHENRTPSEFQKEFEKALKEAWDEYNNGSRYVDAFEDNYVECAFAKGFLAGCIHVAQKMEGNK